MTISIADALGSISSTRQVRSASGYRGVTVKGSRFEAAYYMKKRRVSLGYFSTAELAAAAYDRAVLEHCRPRK